LSSTAQIQLTPPLLLSPHAVQQKQQLEKQTGLKIVEAGVSDVSKTPPFSNVTLNKKRESRCTCGCGLSLWLGS